jgi:hypothetical protein
MDNAMKPERKTAKKRPRIHNHTSNVARVYADQITLEWWKQLDARQRGAILQQYRERNVTPRVE